MKIPCADCGAMILPETAARNEGLCVPCKTGTRADIEASKIAAKRQRELEATDPFIIYWRELIDRIFKTEAGLDSLSTIERQYWAVGCVSGEVYNGGFEQYFFNSAGSTYLDAVDGLEAMGAEASLRLLQEAKQVVFGIGDVPKDTEARREHLATFEDEVMRDRLDPLDRKFCEDPDKLGKLSEVFAIKHGLVQGN